jgi:Flp pilus assembly protein TadD
MTRLALIVLAMSLAGGQSAAAYEPVSDGELRRQVRRLGFDPEVVLAPLDLTAAMRAWLEEEIPPRLDFDDRPDQLLRRLLERDGLGLRYEVGFTGTAREVFESRVGNCLGFTQLFVVLGREIGLPVYYLGVDRRTRYEREGDLIIVSDHMTAALDLPDGRRVLEFSLADEFDYRTARRVPDRTALAMYYSNRGAELMQAGHNGEALERLGVAVELAPDLAQAWANLGVARRRLGDDDGAEAAYRRTLEVDPDHLSAYHNLAVLYWAQGRGDPAGRLLDLLDRRDNRNPFVYLQLGDLSSRRGRGEEALRFYKRAVRLGREHAEIHAALGLWHLGAGDRERAAKWLRRAEKREPEEGRTTTLRRRLREDG